MLFHNSLFQPGSRVQIFLQPLNLEAGGDSEYPHLGTGTVDLPMMEKTVPVAPQDEPKKRATKKAASSTKPLRKTKVKKEAVVEFTTISEVNAHKLQALRDEGQVWVRLDRSFVRTRDYADMSLFREKGKARERAVLGSMAIPYGLLRPLKPENDPLKRS